MSKNFDNNSHNRIVVDGVEYFLPEGASEDTKRLFSHLSDLTRKINSFQFNLEQLVIGRNAVIQQFTANTTGG